ncbi:hypothetical protein JW921_05545 [Candidatus Fermentibacterales bacterium]|nr:hypothetical protein [Candidatus Fermentibacterales bacterium]
MTRPVRLEGRVWVLERDGRLIDDIDTDMIYHNAHLAVTEASQMGQYALGNLKGFSDFASKASAGDLVLAGDNFGSGSSRQHAVDCFISLGILAIMARSFGAIYKRNAINSGLALVEVPGLPDGLIEHHETVALDLETGYLSVGSGEFHARPMSSVSRDIYLAGGLFEYARTREPRA